jgi:hypothetical protein
MVFAAGYRVLDVLWTMLIFFCWVEWNWLTARRIRDAAGSQAGPDSHVRSIVTSSAGRAAGEIQRARQLLDATSPQEFHQLKAKALAWAPSMTEIAGTA